MIDSLISRKTCGLNSWWESLVDSQCFPFEPGQVPEMAAKAACAKHAAELCDGLSAAYPSTQAERGLAHYKALYKLTQANKGQN